MATTSQPNEKAPRLDEIDIEGRLDEIDLESRLDDIDIEGEAAAAAAAAAIAAGVPTQRVSDGSGPLTSLDKTTLGEYELLDQFIQRGGHQPPQPEVVAAAEEDARVRWWQFWLRGAFPEEKTPDDNRPPPEWLETDIRQGISAAEVVARRKRFGWNELESKKTNQWAKMLSFFRGPILYVMELAAVLAAGLRDWVDFGVIVAILLLNAAVGWYQEKQASDIVETLQASIATKATVVRDGEEQTILAREIVPGDIVIIQDGQTIPGDCQLICDYNSPQDFEEFKKLRQQEKLGDAGDESPDEDKVTGEVGGDDHDDGQSVHYGLALIACDQSAITGESLAVDKFMGDTVFYTSGCKRGKAYAVVKTSAKFSSVGKTANLVDGTNNIGHFNQVMSSIGTSLLVLVMFFMLAVWIGGFFRHIPVTSPGVQTLFHYSLVLFIIGVPVGLPVVTTTTLAVGAAYLAKQKAVVQKLSSIESLAGVNVLCSDKTGTLTANKLSLRAPYVADGQDVNYMMAVAALASSHNVESLDHIDKVTLLTLKRYPRAREILRSGWITDKFTPFDPVSKRITCECRLGEDKYVCAKGAPRAIVQLANCSDETRVLYNLKAKEFAARGFRSLGVAVKKNDEDWQLLGMISMVDPPREDTAQTIMEAQALGVPVKMLTGDAIAIAKETCKQLGMGTKVYNAEKLFNSGLSGTLQHDLIARADGFAEVFPEHKYQVVEMLQQRGNLTAMTGDGVNDAPSLKKADCGIAVEGSSEAAQAAADIVFLAPGLGAIILSIKTARKIFQRMKAYIQYRIALCLHLEIFLTGTMIILNETVRPELIVFIALFADLATVAVAYDNAHVEPRPVEWQLKKIWVVSVILGSILAIATWIVRGTMLLPSGGIIQEFGCVQEVLFLQIALTQNWLIFITRGGMTWPSWQLVGAVLVVDVLATLFCIFGWLSGEAAAAAAGVGQGGGAGGVVRGGGRTDLVTVVLIWAYSIGVTIVLATVYYLLNRIQWLSDLGRKDRQNKDTKMENALLLLNKVAIEHDTNPRTGQPRYFLAEKAAAEDEE